MARSGLSALQPYALSLLRIIIGFTFSFHGIQKVFGYFGGHRMPPLSLLGVAGYLELVGGALVLVGLLTRPVAFVLSGLMAVAYFMGHAHSGFLPVVNRGELAVLYCFIYLYLFTAGAGPVSVDAVLSGSRSAKS